jgi:hypothetical protein
MKKGGPMVRTLQVGWFGATLALLASCGSNPSPPGVRDQLSFGVAMAQRELWSEAHFRFAQAARSEPRNPQILNNLAVANEALGNFDAALENYRAALALAPGNAELKGNYDRFVSFYESYRARAEAEAARTARAAAPAAAEESVPETPPAASDGAAIESPGEAPEGLPVADGESAAPPPSSASAAAPAPEADGGESGAASAGAATDDAPEPAEAPEAPVEQESDAGGDPELDAHPGAAPGPDAGTGFGGDPELDPIPELETDDPDSRAEDSHA